MCVEQRNSVTAIPCQSFVFAASSWFTTRVPRTNPVPDKEKEIGKRLRQFRKELGMSQAELARRVGIDSRALGTYEHGRVPLPFHVFMRVHEKFSLNPAWLASGKAVQIMDWTFEENFFIGPIGEREVFSAVWEREMKDRSSFSTELVNKQAQALVVEIEAFYRELSSPVEVASSQLREVECSARRLVELITTLRALEPKRGNERVSRATG